MLTIDRPPTADIGVWQERTALPSTWTVQEPQNPPPQPNFVPVNANSSRRYQSRGISGSPSNVRFDPFTLNVAMGPVLYQCAWGPTPKRCGSTRVARSPRPQALR